MVIGNPETSVSHPVGHEKSSEIISPSFLFASGVLKMKGV